jgi:hypothetical protein
MRAVAHGFSRGTSAHPKQSKPASAGDRQEKSSRKPVLSPAEAGSKSKEIGFPTAEAVGYGSSVGCGSYVGDAGLH